jgi:hypothetical protein
LKFNSLNLLQALFYDHCNAKISNFSIDKESLEYEACTFNLDNLKLLYRKAKITPTKIGQFVTVWKRSDDRVTVPYCIEDKFDYYVVAVQKDTYIGYFIFPINVMVTQGVTADQNRKAGKRGFRVYPIWDKPDNKQAEKTQKWQVKHFLDCTEAKFNYEDVKIKFNHLFIDNTFLKI